MIERARDFSARYPVAPLVWLAYLVVPIEGWGLFSGRPLGGFGGLALAAFCWLWWVRRSLPFPLLAVAALVAKIALGATLLVPRGFDAKYYANAAFAAPIERGTEPADRSSTRTDRQLSFLGGADGDLPVYFLNDNTRFNFYLPNEPAREGLPVSAVWEGWLRVDRAGVRRLYVRNPGGRVEMTIGDDVSVTIPPSSIGWTGYPTLRVGLHRIRISLSIPQGGARTFAAGWTVEGRERPFDAAVVFRQPVTPIGLAADTVLRVISTAFDAILGACLVVGMLSAFVSGWRRLTKSAGARDALAIAWVAVTTEALLIAWPFRHWMATLSGGDDWLSYETMARDIGLNGLWMTAGAALGKGAPFYYQPLYPYFVAATHWLFGDDLYGLLFMQRLLVGGTVIALWRATAALFGERVGCAGLVAALVIVYEKVGPSSGVLLSELLFVPLICLWALLLVRLAKSPKPALSSAAVAGVVGGLATLTRSTLMLGWLLALPLVAISLARTKRVGRIVGVLAAALVAVTLLATARNWVVVRQFVLVSSSGPTNLFFGNRPATPIVVPPPHKATYERLGVDPNLQLVIEYARQSPGAFLEGWRRKTAYALGSFETLAPGEGRSLFYMAVSAAALVGVLLLAARLTWLRGAGLASLIPLSLALPHLAVIVIITVYGERTLLPFYALLVPYVGIVAFGAHQVLWRLVGPGIGLLVCLALAGVSAWRFLGGGPEIDLPVMAIAALLWNVCAYGVPRLPMPAAAVYGALAIGLCLWAAVLGTADAALAGRLGLLFLVTALCSSVSMNGGSRLRVPDRPLLVGMSAVITVLTVVALQRLAAGVPAVILAGLVVGLVQPLSDDARVHHR